MSEKNTISVVVPIFNEAGTVRELHERLVAVLEKQKSPYEIIFVNDGSSDDTYEIARQLKPLTLITHQRNYGETPAFDTGIERASGNIIIFIDADLQDDPAEIPLLLQKIEEGYDVSVGWRQKRNDHWTRIVFSQFANMVVRLLLGLKLHDYGCGLKAYRSKFIKDFRLWGNVQVFLPVVAKERGARVCEVPVSNYFRKSGQAKIKITNMLKAGFDLVSFAFLIKYFSKPLRFFGGWGVFFMILSAISVGTSIILRVMGIVNFTESPLPELGALFITLGIMLFMMGLLAEMLLRMHYASIGSSPYIIRDIVDNK
ncbi:MAG: glycosyltransferase family 2 protein [Patescibacteria group bacterium]